MGIKVIDLDDVEISVLLTGLNLAHSLYFEKKDNASMILSDKLIDLIKDNDVFVGERVKKWKNVEIKSYMIF